MKNILVSIIVPTYNRAHLLPETLDSVLEQSYTNWECLVIDDGSSDNTGEIVNSYCKKDQRFKYYHRPANVTKGANACRNFGFEISKGEYVNWFDDDDVMLNSFIEEKVLNIRDKLNFVISTGYYVDGNLKNERLIPLKDKEGLFKEYVLWKSHILTPSVFFKRDFLVNKDLFNLKIYRGQETEFFSRLFFKTNKINYKIVNTPTFLYRQHANTKTQRSQSFENKYLISQVYIAFKNLERGILLNDTEIINKLIKGLVYFLFRSAQNNYVKTTCSIGFNLFKSIYKIKPIYAVKVCFVTIALVIYGKESYKMESWLMNTEL